ncbi:hypothetical protein [Streptomyces sp. H34-S4]|uniref:hypothetical protein n=1 Tax=Streptomyces sp. H34-S4 TaxID=2996463 RepID=UPI00226F2214|nr:hypothetical protein [Streptomyces sp. H34-S4]MCY0933858.1 hypothetical protein [Streptomyces sp. H34-S4]
MSTASGDRPKLKHLAESRDVYDLLEHVRVRPGMFVRGGSLRELEKLLVGYRAALQVHHLDEDFAFAPAGGPFAEWLSATRGWSMARGWASAIERQLPDEPALDAFFRLLGDFRAGEAESVRPAQIRPDPEPRGMRS